VSEVSGWSACARYAGPQVGFFALPPVGAVVWIEFLGGNPNSPIWVGCFWLTDEVPIAYEINEEDPAQVEVFKTASSTIVINDKSDEGEVKLEIDSPAVSQYPVTLKFNSDGVEINTGVSNIKMNPEDGITATVSDTTVTIQKESIAGESTNITLTAEESEITMDSDSIKATTTEASISATSKTSVESGQVEVTGMTTVPGETTIDGLLAVNA
jgi:uncharacterized protein involved in type VI secretion and phage assembly